MHLRISLAVIAIAGTTAYAQPKKAHRRPSPWRPTTWPNSTSSRRAVREVGPDCGAAAVRAARTSPTVRRKLEEVQARSRRRKPSSFSACRRCWEAVYTRIVAARLDHLWTGAPPIQFLENSYIAEAQARCRCRTTCFGIRADRRAQLAEDVAKLSRRSTELTVAEDARLVYYEWVRAKLQVINSRSAPRERRQVTSADRQFARQRRLDSTRIKSALKGAWTSASART